MPGMATHDARIHPSTRIAYDQLTALCLVVALLVGGCATAAPQLSTAGGDSRSSSAIKRCSPSDPDRRAWLCVVGQILYGVAGAMQPVGGYSLR
jgi:hypothetical protein